jgi:hypothetical protein
VIVKGREERYHTRENSLSRMGEGKGEGDLRNADFQTASQEVGVNCMTLPLR